MIKARFGGDEPGGPTFFLLGLSDRNIDGLKNKLPIMVDLGLMGGPVNSKVCLCWGKTENDILDDLRSKGFEGLPQAPAGEKLPDAQEGLDHGEHYPRGKLNASDEGAVSMAVSVQGHTVVIDFAKPVAWLGLGLSDLERLIAGLQENAAKLRKTMP